MFYSIQNEYLQGVCVCVEKLLHKNYMNQKIKYFSILSNTVNIDI